MTTFRRYLKVAAEGDYTELVDYMTGGARSAAAISMTTAVFQPPIKIYYLDRKHAYEVDRFELKILGSLNEGLRDFLSNAIGTNLIASGGHLSPTEKLVLALSYAATMSAQFNLTADSVGGAFYGASLDGNGFAWQPDMMYVLYSPRDIRESFDTGLADHTEDIDSRTLRIIVQVRDNVGISASLRGSRIALSTSQLLTPDIESWMRKWLVPELMETFFNPEFFVFVPTSQGNTVTVKNTGNRVRATHRSFDLKSDLLDLLVSVPETPFRSVYLQPEPAVMPPEGGE